MDSVLEKTGYTYDAESCLWMPGGYHSLEYGEGDAVENKLARIVAQATDLSLFSSELAAHRTDWPSLYHLSAARANVLQPFRDSLRSGHVLEVGAGCGAITRALGEFGAQVLALEGSARRAAIARSRTRDLSNVTVLAEKFEQFKTEQRFDVVTLIGVLEYASMFSNDGMAAAGMLARACELTASGGKLILAIENQLGLKYFAGFAEDHLAQVMYGVEDRYRPGQPRTFGRAQLTALLKGAGFGDLKFYIPFPDYKLPVSILTEGGLGAADFDSAAFAWQSVSRDLQRPELLHFALERGWPAIFENGLGLELANSFLIVARHNASADEPEPLAYHYSNNRQRRFAKETVFIRESDNSISTRSHELSQSPASEETTGDAPYRHHFIRHGQYIRGQLLSRDLVEILTEPGWSLAQVVAFLTRYLEVLEQILQEQGAPLQLKTGTELLPGRFLDATPQNLIVDPEGKAHYIDAEWEQLESVELGRLLYRGLNFTLESVSKISTPGASVPTTEGELLKAVLSEAGLEAAAANLLRYTEEEEEFQSIASGVDLRDKLTTRLSSPLNGSAIAEPPPFATLYFAATGSDLCEVDSVREPLEHLRAVVALKIPLHAPSPCEIRLDVTDRPGWHLIHVVQIFNAAGQLLWDWVKSSSDACLVDVVEQPNTTGTEATLFYALSHDPQWVFQFPAAVQNAIGPGCTVKLDIEFPDAEQLKARFQALGSHVSTSSHREAKLKIDLAGHQDRETHLSADLAMRIEREAQLAVNLAHHEEREAQLKADLENGRRCESQLWADLSVHKDRQEQLRTELHGANRREAQLNVDRSARNRLITDLKTELARSREGLNSVQGELARLANVEAELNGIKGSALGRAVYRLKWSPDQVPRGPSKHIRRAAKAAYWILTPHLMPARLRWLRERKHGRLPGANTSWGIAPAHGLPYAAGDLAEMNAQVDSPLGITSAQSTASDTVCSEHLALPAFLGFRAGGASLHGGNEAQPADLAGRYRLLSAPEYVYIPPRPPKDLARRIGGMKKKPQFSIVTPVYNTPAGVLRAMIASVKSQWYPFWELILVDDNSPCEGVRSELRVTGDSRITVLWLTGNKGISGATNEGLARASGDYVVFLDHDDELTADCLFELACCIDREDPDYIYSDEDKLTDEGNFIQPFFKPDWSPDTIMSTMYTCHVSCVRREMLNATGGLRSEYDGAQDWDFVLRLVELTSRIAHISKVLYHWRVSPGSIAADLNAKKYAVEASRRARIDALKRRKLEGTLDAVPQAPGSYRVNYAMQGEPLISIVIPSKNNGFVLRQCLQAILERSRYQNFEIVMIDNGSTEIGTLNYLDQIRQHPKITVLRHDAPFNFSELCNKGAASAGGSILLFLNDDTEVLSPTWLEQMAGYAQLRHVGAVGAKLIYPGTRLVQHNGVVNLADGPGHAFLREHADNPGYFARNILDYDWLAITGACMMIEKLKFEMCGGFDESFPIAYNDVELCFRLVEEGLYNLVCQGAELVHYESLSRGLDSTDRTRQNRLKADRFLLYRTHPRYFMHDPFHNPNLHPNDLSFGLPQ